MNNLSSKYLIKLIFTPQSIEELYDTGLTKVFTDDYGYRQKYRDCLLFLFSPERYHGERERTENFNTMLTKMSDFGSFRDYYEVKDPFLSTMLVFEVPDQVKRDLELFKNSAYQRLSDVGMDMMGLTSIDTYKIPTFHPEEEVYRYSLLGK
jgi:hypothetical protein